MINIMYLVLTAMLALNISSEVLNAFLKVRDGMFVTNGTLLAENDGIAAAIKDRASKDQLAAPIAAQADQVQVAAREAYTALKEAYEKIVEQSGKSSEISKVTGMAEPSNLRDRDTPHNVMVSKGEGEKLKKALQKAREAFASVYPTAQQQAILDGMTLQVKDPEGKELGKKDWVHDNFSEVPAVAALAVIAKMMNDVRTTESATLQYLKSQIGIQNIEFDQLQGRTFPKKSYLNAGETYEADIFVSASSSSVKPKVYLGPLDMSKVKMDTSGTGYEPYEPDTRDVPITGTPTELPEADSRGIVKYTAQAGGVGPKEYTGVIEVQNVKTGKFTYYPFKGEYLVGASVAVVSPIKMNMFYIGVDNPVEVSVPGFPSRDVSASMTSGTITPASGDGQYIVKVTTPGTTKVNVSVKSGTGVKSIGSKEFRVSRIPDPKVLLGNKQGPVISSGEIKSMIGLVAIADNFPFDVKFSIRSFSVTYKKARDPNLIEKTNTSGVFSEDVRALLSRCGPGDRVWFDDIKVAAPDGTTRTADLSFKVIGG